MSEHDDQVTLFEWAAVYAREEPRLELMFAIPNQGGKGQEAIKRGKKMVKEGLKKGVPDIFLPVVGVVVLPLLPLRVQQPLLHYLQ